MTHTAQEQNVAPTGLTGQQAQAGPLRCQVLTDWPQAEGLRGPWDDLVERTGGDIYFTFDWCYTWWQYYGRGCELRLLLFWDGPTLVSLLPLVIDRLWIGPVRLRLGRLLGSYFTTVALNPPVASEHGQAVYASCLRQLLGQDGCDAVWFGPLTGHRPHRDALRQACRACQGGVHIVSDRDMGVHTIFQLPETFEQYLASLDGVERSNYRRGLRNLEKMHPLRAESLRDWAAAEGPFEEFARMHAAQWQSQGKLGHFDDWPCALEFNRDLARVMAPLGRLRLDRLSTGGQVVAYEFGFQLGQWLYLRLPARRTGGPWERLGLGRISMVTRIQAAIDAGVRYIESGPGHYDYKIYLGGTEYPLSSMLIATANASAQAKAQLLRGWSDLLHLLYYRIWFSRVAPRLPLPRRPLRRTWIRSHV